MTFFEGGSPMKLRKSKQDNEVNRIDKLCDEVRDAAYQSVEDLWSAFLEVGELDMVKATEKGLRLMTSNGDYTGAMKVLEGIYALVEIAPSENFTGCQQHPALAQMFMEEFLSESGDFIFDVGMDDVLELLMNEGQ